ncbi:SHC-transforming protein 4 isoform X2 [Ascaphus truei]|uniref:SHC-transforming protein 4 isoform X2 n=1 Tax=Ascaphus truei TaxID=8439 RepID=UPI003F5ADD87
MREYNPHSGYTLNEVLLNPVMLQRAKYSRFRNDSLTPTEEGTQSVSLNGKGSSKSHAPAAVPSVPIENITNVTQDSSKPFCTLIPKMSHFKLSNPASLLGLKHFSLGTRELPKIKLAGGHTAPAPAETTLNSYLTAAHVRQGGEVKKEPGDDGVLLEIDTPTTALTKDSHAQHVGHCSVRTGPSYSVKYMGCIEVLQSMRSLDFGMRTQVTREAISRLCEAVPGAKGAGRKRKVVANHHMQSISFASGGDPDTTDYVAYVAKDPVNQRACHILECSNIMAQEVINTIGQAFELRFKQYLKNPSSLIDSSDSEAVSLPNAAPKMEEKEAHEYYNEMPGTVPHAGGVLDKRTREDAIENTSNCDKQHCLMAYPKNASIYENCLENHNILGSPAIKALKMPTCEEELFDDPCYINTVPKTDRPDKSQMYGKAMLKSKSGRQCQGTKASMCSALQINHNMQREQWYHGKMGRKVAERLLVNDGDFLVRESTTSACQYVLSGLNEGHPKHLLLVDPEGKVRTKDHIFENVSHLIKYHVENNLPIISSGSELCLKQPVRNKDFPVLVE